MRSPTLILCGRHLRDVDASGRICLPGEWMDLLREAGVGQWYLVHAEDHLILIPVTERSAALAKLGPPYDKVIVATLPIVGDAMDVPPDSLHRVGISDKAELFGGINSAELWPPHTAPEPTQTDLNRAKKYLGL